MNLTPDEQATGTARPDATDDALDAGWNLLAAMEAVIHRLIGERRIDFGTLEEVERLRDELEDELNEEARARMSSPPERDSVG